MLGLPLALVLAWLYDLTPEGIKRTDDAPQDPALVEIKTRRLDYVIIGAVAATVELIAVDRFAFRGDAPPAAVDTAGAAAEPPATPAASLSREALPNSVAVSSSEAYDLYLQALAVAATAPAGALDLLDRAVSLDRAFAGAYSLRAQVRSLQLGNNVLTDAVPAEEREAAELRVREDANRALELDPADARARAVLADLDVRYGYWSNVPVFEHIDFSNYPPSILWVHAWSGNVERALEVSERWARLDPNSSFAHMNVGIIYAYADDRAASTRSMQRALDWAPTNTLARAFMAYNAVAVGDIERALSELQRLERLLGENPPAAFLPELAYAYGRIGRADDAERLVARIDAIGTERDLGHGARALAYLAIGDEPHALEELELAAAKVRNHESDVSGVTLMNLRMNFLNDPLIRTPRFAEMLERIRGD